MGQAPPGPSPLLQGRRTFNWQLRIISSTIDSACVCMSGHICTSASQLLPEAAPGAAPPATACLLGLSAALAMRASDQTAARATSMNLGALGKDSDEAARRGNLMCRVVEA